MITAPDKGAVSQVPGRDKPPPPDEGAKGAPPAPAQRKLGNPWEGLADLVKGPSVLGMGSPWTTTDIAHQVCCDPLTYLLADWFVCFMCCFL